MKKLLPLLSIFIVPQLLTAQPVIYRDNIAPAGFHANFAQGAAVTPGPAGADQIWDFSTTTLTIAGTYQLVDPATTPYVSLVPASNYCAEIVPSGRDAMYDYFDVQPSKMDKVAQGMTIGDGEIYTDFKTDLVFPFVYQQTYSDFFEKEGGGSGTITRTYDAYGVLITPEQTYEHVVRIHSVWDSGEWLYEWMTTDMVTTVWSLSSAGSRVLVNANTGINTVAFNEADVMLTPIPAVNNCRINGLDQKIADIVVIDITGNIVKNIRGDVHSFSVNGMLPGVYAARIKLESGKIITRKLVVQ
jgi:hypothetical protein